MKSGYNLEETCLGMILIFQLALILKHNFAKNILLVAIPEKKQCEFYKKNHLEGYFCVYSSGSTKYAKVYLLQIMKISKYAIIQFKE
jgi:hypothetical protein